LPKRQRSAPVCAFPMWNERAVIVAAGIRQEV
jgi:hypothetical protein